MTTSTTRFCVARRFAVEAVFVFERPLTTGALRTVGAGFVSGFSTSNGMSRIERSTRDISIGAISSNAALAWLVLSPNNIFRSEGGNACFGGLGAIIDWRFDGLD